MLTEQIADKQQKSFGSLTKIMHCSALVLTKYISKHTLKIYAVNPENPFGLKIDNKFVPAPAFFNKKQYKPGKIRILEDQDIDNFLLNAEITNLPKKIVLLPIFIKNNLTGILALFSNENRKDIPEVDKTIAEYIVASVQTQWESMDDIEQNTTHKRNLQTLLKAIDKSPVSIVITDTSGTIEYVNPYFTKTTGFGFDEVKGKHTHILSSGKQPREFYKNMWQTIQSGKSWQGELINRKKNGELFNELVTITPVIEQTGNIIKYIALKENITEIKKLQAELLEAKKQAEQADKLKDAFLSNMSHEIRTPMNAIIGFSDLLKVPSLTQEQKEKFVDIINQNGAILLNLIDDIIDIAKIESGSVETISSNTDIHELLDELFETYHLQKKQSIKLKLIKESGDENFYLFTDAIRLRQILSNLLSNAYKFTDTGEIHFGYNTKTEQKAQMIEFYVSDTGIGIEKDKIHFIFERFGQSEGSYKRNIRGTGLGLPISKKLVQLLGGDMWVETTKDTGTTFRFTIPLTSCATEKNSEKTKSTEIPLRQNSSKYNWQSKTILIAEDEPANYLFFKEALQKTHAKILWAKNGIEAVEFCKNSQTNQYAIDLILMDLKMPQMDGYEAIREIRSFYKELAINNRPMIIAQTAFTMREEKDRSLKAGCDDFLTKPIRTRELLFKIAQHIDK